jgi:superfamily II DNA or RNA helicase
MKEYEKVIAELKAEIEARPNKSLWRKYSTFLRSFGLKKRSQKSLDLINELLAKYGIEAYAEAEEEWSFTELKISKSITFKLKKQENSKMETTLKIPKVQSEAHGQITTEQGISSRKLYPHQEKILRGLNSKIEENPKDYFAGLVVIPTGGGKTYTAVHWLLKNAIDKNKKILWIAHRHALLEQALNTFKSSAYSSLLPKVKKFNYRIISGFPKHHKPVHIEAKDDIIISGKDSMNTSFEQLLDRWLKPNNLINGELFLVIDEAHHATAPTYRKLIEKLKKNVKKLTILGLTATPFRTAEAEKGLLKKIFIDDIIPPKVDLRELIQQGILADPLFEEEKTGFNMAEAISEEDIQNLARRYKDFDKIGEKTAKTIAENADRNSKIVDHYIKHKGKYKQTIVFALNQDNAIALNTLFNEKHIKSAYVISNDINEGAVTTNSAKKNEESIERFRNGEIDVLINVNILTEGTDLPKVQTIFLTRPTNSTILMTQMIGRGLRGEKAGGTKEAYIVSFIDEWKDKVSWVNPERLFIEENVDFNDKSPETQSRLVRLISIEKIEEFTKLMDGDIDNHGLKNLDFIQRIPLGIYMTSYLETLEDEDEEKYVEVLVYDHLKSAYDEFIDNLPELGLDENLSQEKLEEITNEVEELYFLGLSKELAYRKEDIKSLIKAYSINEIKPQFIPLNDREKYDIDKLAKDIYDKELGGTKKDEYIDDIWNKEQKHWKVLFGLSNLRAFIEELDLAIRKISPHYSYMYKTNNKTPKDTKGEMEITKLPLYEIKNHNPQLYRELVEGVYTKAKDKDGFYHCAKTGFKSKKRADFQIDHIKPLHPHSGEGGLSVLENLQLLRKSENIRKGNKV